MLLQGTFLRQEKIVVKAPGGNAPNYHHPTAIQYNIRNSGTANMIASHSVHDCGTGYAGYANNRLPKP